MKLRRKTTALALGEVMKPVKKRPKKVNKCVGVSSGAIKLTVSPENYSEIEFLSSRGFSLWMDTEQYAGDDTEWAKIYRSERIEKVREAKIIISLLNEFISSAEDTLC
jgi:hypothetical protein